MRFLWKKIQNQIDIDAGLKVVWEILVDVNNYKNWNPFLLQALGSAREGSFLELTMSPPGASPRQKKVMVTTLKPCNELSWKGIKVHSLYFSGHNRFKLISLSESQTRIVQEEIFTGLLVPFISAWLDQHMAAGFRQMLAALKSKIDEQMYKR